MEIAGIPTTIVTREGFTGVVANAFAGYGFPSEAPVTVEFPNDMFLVGSDLTPLSENMEVFLQGLTTWQPASDDQGTELETLTYTGADYAEAVSAMTQDFLANLWSDGLPFTPPTVEYVDWLLTGTDLDPDYVVGGEENGIITPRGAIASVRSLAVCLAMAGGRPEYLPFLIAAVASFVNPDATSQSWSSTTNSTVPAFVVNGAAARQIRLGSGYGCMGPDATHPAGQVLGRAIRIMMEAMGGCTAGAGTMAVFGGMRATNVFFAEDEEGIPEGWPSQSEARGWDRSRNVVTMHVINGMNNCILDFGGDVENNHSLNMMAGMMASPNFNRYSGKIEGENVNTGLVVLPRGFVSALQSDNGYTLDDVKQYLWDHSKVSQATVDGWCQKRAAGFQEKMKEYFNDQNMTEYPVCMEPGWLNVVIAGGDHSGHLYWLAPVTQGYITDAEVQLPANWDQLLADAEADLGVMPTTR